MPLPRRTLVIATAMAMLVIALFALGMRSRPVNAQDLGLAITKELAGGQVVQVGQILEFTIRITNTGSLPLVELELVDQFVGSIVAPSGLGPFAKPGDPPLSDTQPFSYDGAETIRWNLLGNGQRLEPGQSLAVVVRLRAVRPTADLQTVNRARVERAVRSDGQQEGGGGAEVPARPEGARLPMTKSLGVPAPVQAGLPITFTIIITNDGAADLLTLPLRDQFNPAALRFERAEPPPDGVDQAGGVLEWSDLLVITGRGRLGPGESLTVVTVYTALRDIESAVNVAEVSGARDEFGNALEARRAEAPIRIVDDATATPAEPEPTRRPRATATATPVATATPTATTSVVTPTAVSEANTPTAEALATATVVVPASLPATGDPPSPGWELLLAAVLLAAAGVYGLARRRG